MGDPPPGCWLLPDESLVSLGLPISIPPAVNLERRDWVWFKGEAFIVWGVSGSWHTLVTTSGALAPKVRGRGSLRITASSLLNAWNPDFLRLLDLESAGLE
jgi:hypothetical protein